jgi:hypothetical protein
MASPLQPMARSVPFQRHARGALRPLTLGGSRKGCVEAGSRFAIDLRHVACHQRFSLAVLSRPSIKSTAGRPSPLSSALLPA